MSFGGGSSGGGQTQVVSNEPYAPAQPALNQIVSDASAIYGQGPQYVAPTTQQLTKGLAAQENIANLANTQIADTISGQYSNPFLSPLIADVASSAYTNVAQQFSGAGRTPGSPMSQQQVVSQLGKQALPLAFQAYNAERNRQLQTARAVPSLTSVGQELRGLEQERVMAPFENLQRFQSVIGPVASGLPSRQASTEYESNPNRYGSWWCIIRAAMLGDMFGKAGMGAAIGGGFGLLGGLL